MQHARWAHAEATRPLHSLEEVQPPAVGSPKAGRSKASTLRPVLVARGCITWRQAKLPPPKPCMSRMAVPGVGEGFCSTRKACDEPDEPAITGCTLEPYFAMFCRPVTCTNSPSPAESHIKDAVPHIASCMALQDLTAGHSHRAVSTMLAHDPAQASPCARSAHLGQCLLVMN